jgi:hypothetical protein
MVRDGDVIAVRCRRGVRCWKRENPHTSSLEQLPPPESLPPYSDIGMDTTTLTALTWAACHMGGTRYDIASRIEICLRDGTHTYRLTGVDAGGRPIYTHHAVGPARDDYEKITCAGYPIGVRLLDPVPQAQVLSLRENDQGDA